jgi:hypothetical protein
LKKGQKGQQQKNVWPKTLQPVYYLSDLFVTFDAVGYDIRTKILHFFTLSYSSEGSPALALFRQR